MSSSLADALATIRAERQTLSDRIEKLDQAILALSAIEDDGVVRVPSTAVAPRPSDPSSGGGRRGPSLRVIVTDMVRQYPNGITPRQITDRLAEQQDPRIKLDNRDPTSPVRNALLTARTAGEIYKGDDGAWRAVVARAEPVSEDRLALSSAAADGPPAAAAWNGG